MKCFFDTNIVVYANDRLEPVKREQAADLLTETASRGAGVVSTQVLMEYAAVAVRRLQQPTEEIHGVLRRLELMEIVTLTPTVIHRAIDIRERYRLSHWDACIIAAAESARCGRIYSEDLNSGQRYCGIEVVDPLGG